MVTIQISEVSNGFVVSYQSESTEETVVLPRSASEVLERVAKILMKCESTILWQEARDALARLGNVPQLEKPEAEQP